MALHVVRDRATQAREAQIGTVPRAAFLQRVDGGLADVPRRGEIRLADTEGNHVPHGLDDFEKIADARAGNIPDVIGNGDAHGETASRSGAWSK